MSTRERSQSAVLGPDQPTSVETSKRAPGDAVTIAEGAASPTEGSARRGLSDRTVAWLVAGLMAFNVLDAALTLALVHAGLADEANPVMAASLSAGPKWFVLHKAVLVGGGLTVLWLTRRRKLAQLGLVLCFAVYGALMVVHVWSCRLLMEHYLG